MITKDQKVLWDSLHVLDDMLEKVNKNAVRKIAEDVMYGREEDVILEIIQDKVRSLRSSISAYLAVNEKKGDIGDD